MSNGGGGDGVEAPEGGSTRFCGGEGMRGVEKESRGCWPEEMGGRPSKIGGGGAAIGEREAVGGTGGGTTRMNVVDVDVNEFKLL